jgi:hypothetical protein
MVNPVQKGVISTEWRDLAFCVLKKVVILRESGGSRSSSGCECHFDFNVVTMRDKGQFINFSLLTPKEKLQKKWCPWAIHSGNSGRSKEIRSIDKERCALWQIRQCSVAT